MDDLINLDSSYSTTKLVTEKKPENSTFFFPKNLNRNGEGGLRTKGYFKKSYLGKTLISIVTVVYNGEKFLEEAIESVLNQDYDNIEYIVIDGGSTDSTVDIIKKYEDEIDYWVSEPDEGQSDAFIKAFSLVSGDFISWLNADDHLLPYAITNLVEAIYEYPSIKWFMGNTIHINENNQIINCRLGEEWNILFSKLKIINAYGPSSFFSRELFESVDGIDPKIHLSMDTDLWLQFYGIGERYKRLDNYIWTFRHHPGSKTMGDKEPNSHANNKGIEDRGVIQYKKEVEYICKKHKHCKNRSIILIKKFYLNLVRLFSFRYLLGRIDSILYKNKDYLYVIKKLNNRKS